MSVHKSSIPATSLVHGERQGLARGTVATRVAANDKAGRERLCRYILRPPLANDRLHILPEGAVRLDFKKPWSDGTSSIDLEPLAPIVRLTALVPSPRRHLTRYCGVLSSHSSLRSQIVPKAQTGATATAADNPPRKSKHIPWAELLRGTFAIEVKCNKCGSPLRLIVPEGRRASRRHSVRPVCHREAA